MYAVGSILEPYDSDKMIPVYGFGGIPKYGSQNGHTSHCFALNGDDKKPSINGIEAIIGTYKSKLNQINLNGPTYLHHILKECHRLTAENKQLKQYTVLLILTDGDIDDM